MWQEPRREKVECPDGSVRTFLQTREPDTFFTMPGRVQVRGTSVSGFLWYDSDLKGNNPRYRFTPYSDRKNAALLRPTDV